MDQCSCSESGDAVAGAAMQVPQPPLGPLEEVLRIVPVPALSNATQVARPSLVAGRRRGSRASARRVAAQVPHRLTSRIGAATSNASHWNWCGW
jgi:hypothetical protein